ncbi:hypothetical protein [Streptomyces sp. MZ04]|uniref:hypothetical protein n=1 Tax=Streptomyces sp. MZ04 TaxID=2559236 RepID=UPI00107E9A9F|nr:hypothetical protein [Streptomyces sp. MZ04]TGB14145.1 hypothetical protein E2651_07100 [Streptomyces sp. MZ04]
MVTDAWISLRDRVAALYPPRSVRVTQLEESREALLLEDSEASSVESDWEMRLRWLLREYPGSVGELRSIIDEFEEPTGGRPQVRNTVSAGSADKVVQAGVINSLTFQGTSAAANDHVDFSDGTFNGSVVGVQHHHYGTPPPSTPAAADSWSRIDQLSPPALGIRPARQFDDEPGEHPYVPRDCDEELEGMVVQAVRLGGLVVVTGEPLSGKTTAAWAALHQTLSEDTRVYAPLPGTDLRDIPSQLRSHDPAGVYVVWLDDLDGHLGEHGLTAGLLARLAAEKVLVLATMSDEAYETHRFGRGPASRLLSGAGSVQLSCRWSEAELARLAESDDPRLVDAARWRGERGVTEFLAVGPELWEEWRRSARRNPLGYSLVRAAIDVARCGLEGDVPMSLLRSVCIEYNFDTGDVGDEAYESAMSWAVEPRLGVVGLCVSGASRDTLRAYGSLVVDAVRSEGAELLVPDSPNGVLTRRGCLTWRPLQRLLDTGDVTAPDEQGMPELIHDLTPELDNLSDVLLEERDRERHW